MSEHTCLNTCMCICTWRPELTSGAFLITPHLIFWGKISQLAYSSWFRYSGWPGNFQDLPASPTNSGSLVFTTVSGFYSVTTIPAYGAGALLSQPSPVLILYLAECSYLWLWSTYPVKSSCWGFHSMYFSGGELWSRNHHFGFKPQLCHFLPDLWPVASNVTLWDCFLWSAIAPKVLLS